MATIDYKQKIKDYMNSSEVDTLYKSMLNNLFPELAESEDERIRKELIVYCQVNMGDTWHSIKQEDYIAWLEKQGEQKPTQEIEPFEAEHGKYYYCIKDYFCGGKKQASKGNVVQALRGLPIMGLKDASEYFLPVNFIKCNSAWSEEDEKLVKNLISTLSNLYARNLIEKETKEKYTNLLKSLKNRVQPKQEWSEEDEETLKDIITSMTNLKYSATSDALRDIYNSKIDWLKSLRPQSTWKPSEEQFKVLNEVLNFAANHESPHWNDYIFGTLINLIKQLKRLREE